jgi:hypothetical protein
LRATLKENPVKYAAAAGVAIILATIAAFLLIPQRQIAGSNNLARQGPAVVVFPKGMFCERLPSVPGGAGYVRLGVTNRLPAVAEDYNNARSKLGVVRGLEVTVEAAGARPNVGTARLFKSGRVDIPLSRPADPASKGRICFRSFSRRPISIYGEQKELPDGTFEGRAAVTFLEADESNMLSRLKLIARRHGFTHAGFVGSWTLVPAALFFLFAAGLALWLAIRPPEKIR